MCEQPPLGHKAPRPGQPRLRRCTACRDTSNVPQILSCRHVLESCEAVQDARSGITDFLSACKAAGLTAYHLFVTGKTPELIDVPFEEYIERGNALLMLQSARLQKLSN